MLSVSSEPKAGSVAPGDPDWVPVYVSVCSSLSTWLVAGRAQGHR